MSIESPIASGASRRSFTSRTSHAPRSSFTVKSAAPSPSSGLPPRVTATVCSTTCASDEATTPRPFTRIVRSATRPRAVLTRAVSGAVEPGRSRTARPHLVAGERDLAAGTVDRDGGEGVAGRGDRAHEHRSRAARALAVERGEDLEDEPPAARVQDRLLAVEDLPGRVEGDRRHGRLARQGSEVELERERARRRAGPVVDLPAHARDAGVAGVGLEPHAARDHPGRARRPRRPARRRADRRGRARTGSRGGPRFA